MFANIQTAIQDLQLGKMVIIVDDEERENEGDLAFAAEKVTPELINFMSTFGKGLICIPMLGRRLDELDLTSMVKDNTSSNKTAFTISVDEIKDTLEEMKQSLTKPILGSFPDRTDGLE